jgi:hypothetical protein
MGHIKSKRRMKLGTISLEALMRVRMNMPNRIGQFAASKYVKKWIADGHILSDDYNQRQKKARHSTISMDEEEIEEDNEEFMDGSTHF